MASSAPFGDRLSRAPVASARQCRAARGLLNWTQRRLAEEAGVARKTIADLEVGLRPLRYRTRRDITQALERAGIEFLWSNEAAGEGVRLAEPSPVARARMSAGRSEPNPSDTPGRK